MPRQGKKNRTSKAYAKPSKFDRQNIVSDYIKNLNNKLQTSSGPNITPIRVLKPGNWHPQYDANEGGGTVPAWYDGSKVSFDPTARRYQSTNALPNQRETMTTLSHELGHQRASYQLGGDKTLAYLDMYNQQHPAAPGAFEEVQRKVALAKQNNQSMFNGGLPIYNDWNPALTVHDQPSEIWASQYGDALTQGKVNQLPSQWRYTYTPDMGPKSAEYLKGKGALPQGTVDPVVASGVAARDTLMGADYSKEKRRVARKLNEANYPYTAIASNRPGEGKTTTTTKPKPTTTTTTTKPKHKERMNRLEKTRNQRRKKNSSTSTSFSNGA